MIPSSPKESSSTKMRLGTSSTSYRHVRTTSGSICVPFDKDQSCQNVMVALSSGIAGDEAGLAVVRLEARGVVSTCAYKADTDDRIIFNEEG